MADLPISELDLLPATIDDSNTLLVAQQGAAAYKITGHMLITELATLLDAHGGIRSIAKTSTSGLVDTYTITFADNSTATYSVTNGKGISGITTYYAVSSNGTTAPNTWYTTMQTMTSTNRYLWSYQHIAYNDNTSVDTVKTVIGVYGDKGNTGNTGSTGAASSVTSQSIQYAASSSGTTAPSSGWGSSVPSVSPGDYLWTKVSVTFNDNTTTTWYSCSRQGVNGIPGSQAFQITLLASGWSNNTLTISDNRFVASGYYYVVTPSGTSALEAYSDGVYALDVTTDGQITFYCAAAPSSDLVMNILKVMT